jgi:hypothetical protein
MQTEVDRFSSYHVFYTQYACKCTCTQTYAIKMKEINKYTLETSENYNRKHHKQKYKIMQSICLKINLKRGREGKAINFYVGMHIQKN